MNVKKISVYGLLLTSIVACNKTEYKNHSVPENFNSILYLQETGEQDVSLYNTGDDTSYGLTVVKSGYNTNAEAQASFRVLDEVSLEEYSRLVGKSYKLLPTSAYEITKGDFSFSSSDKWLKGEVNFKTNEVNRILTTLGTTNTDTYVLPLELVKGRDNDSINSERKLILLRPQVVVPRIQYTIDNENINWTGTDNEKTYNFTLSLPFVSPWDFEATIAVDNESLGDNYYRTNTDSYYEIPNGGKVMFKKGATQSEPIAIKVKNAENIIGPSFGLPIKVTAVTKQGVEYPSVAFKLNMIRDFNRIPLQASNLSTNAQEPTEGPIANAVDGNSSTFFHSAWSQNISGNHYFQVSLGKSVRNMVFQYQRRHNGNGGDAPQEVKIYVSNDGSQFTEIKHITSGLPTQNGAWYTSEIMGNNNQEFSHIRFEVIKNKVNSKFFVLAEFNVFGK